MTMGVWSTHLNSSKVRSEVDVGLLEVGGPGGEETGPELLVEVASVGHEGRGEEDVSGNGGHLTLEGFAAGLPALLLVRQTGQKSLASLHLHHHSRHTRVSE